MHGERWVVEAEGGSNGVCTKVNIHLFSLQSLLIRAK